MLTEECNCNENKFVPLCLQSRIKRWWKSDEKVVLNNIHWDWAGNTESWYFVLSCIQSGRFPGDRVWCIDDGNAG